MKKRRIALFGGTFDPIHLGHTTVAAHAIKHIEAEKLIFIPAKRSPLKGFSPKASDDDRLNMINLAIAGEESFIVSDYELNKPAPSYTLDTVKRFQADYGGETEIYWLVGADGIEDLVYWHKINELIDACNLAAMYRAGCKPPDFKCFEDIWGRQRVEKLQRNIIQTPLVDVSSTQIRQAITKGAETAGMLHPKVADYIHKHGLYESETSPGKP